MRILLDHCVPKRIDKLLAGHMVKTTRQMRWEYLRNGNLLAAAALHFDVFLTVDQGIEHQQNPTTLPMAVVIPVAPSNRLRDLAPLVSELLASLQTLAPCTLVRIPAERS